MTTEARHAHLWGQRARDWAEVQEAMVRLVYEAVLKALDPAPGQRLLDMGCGSGMLRASPPLPG